MKCTAVKLLIVKLFAVALIAIVLSPLTHAITLKELEDNAAQTQGFVTLIKDQDNGKVYLKITNLGEEFIYQTSLPHGLGSNDIGLDRGQLGSTSLAVFERVGNKVFLKQKPTRFRAITDNANEVYSIEQAFASSNLWGFTVEQAEDDWVLVDATDFMLQDIHGVGRTLTRTKQGKGYKVDASRSAPDFAWSKTFPDNTELQAIVTLTGTEPGDYLRDTAPNPYSVTLKMRHSFVRLPDSDYRPRPFLPKSGFWSVSFRDYAQPINQSIEQKFIPRHRLEKKDPDAASSEAIEPIVYYLDSGAPEPVRSALLDGARWWNQAFEAIGYKDAFQVRILPDDADPMDVRYNVIQWVHRATRGWSYGFSVIDPRTGEILKGHVSLGSLRVRQDYLIAQGMMAPFSEANPNEKDQALQELALARIRQLSAHEIGHTLGIAHNFAASNYGRESVMDYPHPLFELDPNDSAKIIAPNAYAVGMGKWDLATIAYGYQHFEPENELRELNALIARNDANGLLYISDPDSRSVGSAHAHSSLWDNGSDPVEELARVIELRHVALANFGLDNLKQGDDFSDLEEILVPVYLFHRYQTTAAAKVLGGIDYDYGTYRRRNNENTIAPLKVIPAEQQQKALATLLETLSPEFLAITPNTLALLPPIAYGSQRSRESVNGKTNVSFDALSLPASSAQHTLNALLHPERINRLVQQHAQDKNIPSLFTIAQELRSKVIEPYYQGAQRTVHHTVIDLIYANYQKLRHGSELTAAAQAELAAIIEEEKEFLKRQVKKSKRDANYRGLFLQQLSQLDAKNADAIKLPSIPPGSPI